MTLHRPKNKVYREDNPALKQNYNYALHDLIFQIDECEYKLYTKDFYGYMRYNKLWDAWRKEFIKTIVHQRTEFPFYVADRCRLFNAVVDRCRLFNAVVDK